MRAALFAFLLCSSLAGSLQAQTIPSPFRYIETKQSVGAFVGYLWTNPSIQVDSLQGEIDFGPRSAPLFGVRYGYRLGGPLAIEGSFALAPSEREVFQRRDLGLDLTTVQIESTGETVGALLALAEAGFRFNLTGDRTWNGLAPFIGVTGGVVTELGRGNGVEKDLPDSERFEFGPGFAIGAGLGTEWFPSDRLSLRVELRDVLWRVEVPTGLRPNAQTDPSGWNQNFGVVVGAAVHF